MRIQVRIRCDAAGRWSVQLPPHHAKFTAGSLPEAFDYAKRACAAAPAIIELFSAGDYVLSIVQDQGWPLPVCVAAHRQTRQLSMKFAEIVRRLSRLFRGWWSYHRASPLFKVQSLSRLRSRKIARGPWRA
jgi:hypothetical protein